MALGSTWPIVIVTAFGLAAGSFILILAFSGNSSPREGNPSNFMSGLVDSNAIGSVGIAEAANLPLDVKNNFRQTEKLGDAKSDPSSLAIEENFIDPDEHCEYCFRIDFEPGAIGKAGAVLKADKPKNIDGAQRMIFFARGESGAETVQFSAAGKLINANAGPSNDKELKYAFTSKEIKLEKQWHRYEIDLSSADLARITHAFEYQIVDSNNIKSPITIFIKGVAFDERPAENPLEASEVLR